MDLDTPNLRYRRTIDGKKTDIGSTDDEAAKYIQNADGDYGLARAEAEYALDEFPALADRIDELAKKKAVVGEIQEEVQGHLYEVDIPDSAVDNMLDWDAPLSKQPEVKEKLMQGLRHSEKTDQRETVGVSGTMARPSWGALADDIAELETDDILFSGERLYRMLTHPDVMGFSQQEASEYLNSLSIKGIKYYDAASRGKGKGTRNLVVFDEDIIEIIKRNEEELKP